MIKVILHLRAWYWEVCYVKARLDHRNTSCADTEAIRQFALAAARDARHGEWM